MSHLGENLVIDASSRCRRWSDLKGGLGAKQPASNTNSSEERANFLTDLISGSMLASPKKSNIKKYTNKITKTNKPAQKTITNSILTPTLLLFLLIPTACKTTCKKQNQVNRVLQKQGQLLQNLKQDRIKKKLNAKIEQDLTLKDSETRLLNAIEALIQSNRKLRQALMKKEKPSE